MPISCPHDGTEHPDHARFCILCGRPLPRANGASASVENASRARETVTAPDSPPPQWEYLDVVVQLDAVAQTMHAAIQLAIERYRQALSSQLTLAVEAGWEPDGSHGPRSH